MVPTPPPFTPETGRMLKEPCASKEVCKRKKALEQSVEVGAGRWGEQGGGERREGGGEHSTQGNTESTQQAHADTNNTEGKNTRGENPKVVWRSPDILQGLGLLTYIGRHLYNRVTGDSGLG